MISLIVQMVKHCVNQWHVFRLRTALAPNKNLNHAIVSTEGKKELILRQIQIHYLQSFLVSKFYTNY